MTRTLSSQVTCINKPNDPHPESSGCHGFQIMEYYACTFSCVCVCVCVHDRTLWKQGSINMKLAIVHINLKPMAQRELLWHSECLCFCCNMRSGVQLPSCHVGTQKSFGAFRYWTRHEQMYYCNFWTLSQYGRHNFWGLQHAQDYTLLFIIQKENSLLET